MQDHHLTTKRIAAYERYLRAEQRSVGTLEKYLRDVRAFATWLDGKAVAGERLAAWKAHLQSEGYAPATINSMLECFVMRSVS